MLILTFKKCFKINRKNSRQKDRNLGKEYDQAIHYRNANGPQTNEKRLKLSVVEMQIKRTMRCHFSPIRLEKNIKY